jgi:hypothetical protein
MTQPASIATRRKWARFLRRGVGQAVWGAMLRFTVCHRRVTAAQWGDRPALRIGILSDLHFGFAPMSPSKITQIKRRLLATKPDIIVFLGDLAGGFGRETRTRNVPLGAELLSGLDAPLGCYAILGNHDWHDDPEAHRRGAGPVAAAEMLNRAGFHVLQNTAVQPGNSPFWLAGLDSQHVFRSRHLGGVSRSGTDDIGATLAQVKGADPVILLAHEPDIFPELTDNRIVLTLSGHTHAGQLRMFNKAFYVPSRHGPRFAYGHHQIGTQQLIVSAGLGASTLPLRLGIYPEITIVDVTGPAVS